MAKYRIIYMSDPTVEVDDAVLTLVNQPPNPLPPPSQPWTSYKHDNKTVMEISTEDRDASLIIVPPLGGTLHDQNVDAKLGLGTGQHTKSTWKASGNGMQLDMIGDASATTFDLTDSHLPPQALRVTVKRPI